MLAEDPALTHETFVLSVGKLRGSLDLEYCGFECFKIGIMCGVSAAISWWDAPAEDLLRLADKELDNFPMPSLEIAMSIRSGGGKTYKWPAYAGFWMHEIYGGSNRRFALDRLCREHSQEAYYAGLVFGVAAALKKYR